MGTKSTADKLPKIFYVNWFRKNQDGKWLWPGYGENSRVLKWIFERTSGEGKAVETEIGYMPTIDAIDRSNLKDVTDSDMAELIKVNKDEWMTELKSIKENYSKFGDRIPKELISELSSMEKRFSK